VQQAVASFQPDLIHCHGGRAAFFQSWTRHQIPWLYTVHGFHFSHKSFLARKLAILAERRSIKCASSVIFVSEYDRQLALREHLLPASQTVADAVQALMVLGCAAGQSSPFFWIATHRRHHRHSDDDGDPHSPHTADGRPQAGWRGFWHAHQGWLRSRRFGYPPAAVRDLARRPDLAWIDRHWFLWYAAGLVVPAAVGFAVGGTAYDALLGFLWGGLLRLFLTTQATFLVNSLNHTWGTRPYPTGDHSRNNLLTGLLAFGEGWHNNHHAFPWSARHGLRWWQPDLSWWVLWAMEKTGLVWRVRRANPRTALAPSHPAILAPAENAVA